MYGISLLNLFEIQIATKSPKNNVKRTYIAYYTYLSAMAVSDL